MVRKQELWHKAHYTAKNSSADNCISQSDN